MPLIDAAFDGFSTASEHVLARLVLTSLRPGMLLLADRNFPGHQLWGEAIATGADLAWRLKKNTVFIPTAVLPDGSFLSVIGTPAENVRYGQARAAGRPLPGPPTGHTVRIVEYAVTVSAADGSSRVEPFRLVTSLLDHQIAPADQLAALYHQRWEIEALNKDGKHGAALRHLPSGHHAVNSVWIWAALLACAISAWIQEITGIDYGNGRSLDTVTRLRRELINIPARLAHRAGVIYLRLPPGEQLLTTVLPRLQALPRAG